MWKVLLLAVAALWLGRAVYRTYKDIKAGALRPDIDATSQRALPNPAAKDPKVEAKIAKTRTRYTQPAGPPSHSDWQRMGADFDRACRDFDEAGIMQLPDQDTIEETISGYALDEFIDADKLRGPFLFARLIENSGNVRTLYGAKPGKESNYTELFAFLFGRAAPDKHFEMRREERGPPPRSMPVELSFIFDGREYDFTLTEGAFLDVYWAVETANEILESHGLSYRAISLTCNEDNYVILVTDPDVAKPLLDRYLIGYIDVDDR